MPTALRVVAAQGAPKVKLAAENLLGWLSLGDAERAEHWQIWCGGFLLDDGKPRGLGALISPNLAKARPDLAEALAAEQQRIAAVEDDRRALRVAAVSAALVRLAMPVAARLRAAQGQRRRCSTTTT